MIKKGNIQKAATKSWPTIVIPLSMTAIQ